MLCSIFKTYESPSKQSKKNEVKPQPPTKMRSTSSQGFSTIFTQKFRTHLPRLWILDLSCSNSTESEASDLGFPSTSDNEVSASTLMPVSTTERNTVKKKSFNVAIKPVTRRLGAPAVQFLAIYWFFFFQYFFPIIIYVVWGRWYLYCVFSWESRNFHYIDIGFPNPFGSLKTIIPPTFIQVIYSSDSFWCKC